MCNHIFEGRADGVTCILCGYHMTAAEYFAYVSGNTAVPMETAAAAFAEIGKEAPKRTRKKKEAKING